VEPYKPNQIRKILEIMSDYQATTIVMPDGFRIERTAAVDLDKAMTPMQHVEAPQDPFQL
jgi:hypothetical protein